MNDHVYYSDKELFRLVEQGNERAFEMLFHRHNARLLPFISSIIKSEQDAREVVQEIFMHIWLRRETLSQVNDPESWVNGVAYKMSCERLRKIARYNKRIVESATRNAVFQDNLVVEQLDAKYTREVIEEAVNLLPYRRRQIFELSRKRGLSRREIAQELNISENTVRNQLADAVAFVQDYLQKNASVYIPVLLILWREV